MKSMCKGEAANHLLARIRKDSLNCYENMNDMFEHL
jgi:hypothetical protein